MIERGLRLVGCHDLGGAPNGGEGMGMMVTAEGRHPPTSRTTALQAMCILDVTKLERPELLW